jgi:hypothetical protein
VVVIWLALICKPYLFGARQANLLGTSFFIHSDKIEVRLEGSEDFLKEQIKDLLAFIAEHSANLKTTDHEPEESAESPSGNASNPKISVNSIAAKLGVSKGTDLILAAAYRLTRDGQTSFKRDALADEMKLATNFYKTTYLNNLTAYLKTLMGNQKLLEQSSGVYALHSDAMKELEQRLA